MLCKAAEANWPFGPGLAPTLNPRIIMIEQEYFLCWSCLLTDRSAALPLSDQWQIRPVTAGHRTKEPATDNPFNVVGKTGDCTIPLNWSVSNNKSTVWELPLIVEGQLTTLSLLPLWLHWRLTWILDLASLLIYSHSDPLITWLNYSQFIIMKGLTVPSFVSFHVIFHRGNFRAKKIQQAMA